MAVHTAWTNIVLLLAHTHHTYIHVHLPYLYSVLHLETWDIYMYMEVDRATNTTYSESRSSIIEILTASSEDRIYAGNRPNISRVHDAIKIPYSQQQPGCLRINL